MSRVDDALKRAGRKPHPRIGADVDVEAAQDAWEVAQSDAAALFPAPVKSPQPQADTIVDPAHAARHPDGRHQPIMQPIAALQAFRGDDNERLVVSPGIRPDSLEQYRKLAATLHHAQCERGVKVVMVASAVSGEGKSLSTTNLALTFSESYRRRVIVVDADLRRPSQHDIFNIPNVAGLSECLKSDDERPASTIQVSPRLAVIPGGRPDPDPMGALTSSRMTRILREAAAAADWVLIDTPPVGLMPDARLLADMADAVILVVRAGRTPYPLVQRAADAVGREKILGVILNAAEREGLSGDYDYTSYYAYYGANR
jgi:capsular exopolysaccharide synthesis family protein